MANLNQTNKCPIWPTISYLQLDSLQLRDVFTSPKTAVYFQSDPTSPRQLKRFRSCRLSKSPGKSNGTTRNRSLFIPKITKWFSGGQVPRCFDGFGKPPRLDPGKREALLARHHQQHWATKALQHREHTIDILRLEEKAESGAFLHSESPKTQNSPKKLGKKSDRKQDKCWTSTSFPPQWFFQTTNSLLCSWLLRSPPMSTKTFRRPWRLSLGSIFRCCSFGNLDLPRKSLGKCFFLFKKIAF